MNIRVLIFVILSFILAILGQAFDDFGQLDSIDEDQSFLESDSEKDQKNDPSRDKFNSLEKEIKKETWTPIEPKKPKKAKRRIKKKKKPEVNQEDLEWLEAGDDKANDNDDFTTEDLRLEKDLKNQGPKERLSKNPNLDKKIPYLQKRISKKPNDLEARMLLASIGNGSL